MPPTYRTDVLGFATRRTRRGALVVELDLEADPRKRDPAWQANMRLLQGENKWRREFLRDWTISSGRAYYPEVVATPSMFVKQAKDLLDAPVYRGWDFGFHRPACLFSQYSPRTDRLWLLRECAPENINVHAFAGLVQYLSGQIDIEQLKKWPRAMFWLTAIEANAADPKTKVPKPPWFSPGTRFIDYAGPEATKVSGTVEGEHAARTDAEVLRTMGITLNMLSSSLASREDKIRKLLTKRADGYPGLLVDPACRKMWAGLNGGVSLPEATKAVPSPTKPKKDGWFEDLHDCLGYTVINLVPAREYDPWGEGEVADDGVELADLKETRGMW